MSAAGWASANELDLGGVKLFKACLVRLGLFLLFHKIQIFFIIK